MGRFLITVEVAPANPDKKEGQAPTILRKTVTAPNKGAARGKAAKLGKVIGVEVK